jgi:hypothetical protein
VFHEHVKENILEKWLLENQVLSVGLIATFGQMLTLMFGIINPGPYIHAMP